MPILHEGMHTAEYLLSEGNGNISRETVTLTGGNYVAGTVLGQITADGRYTQHDPAATNGSENAAAILYMNVDASTANVEITITKRQSEVAGDRLTWIAGILDADKANGIASLALDDIVVR